jgi:hypothetical protein
MTTITKNQKSPQEAGLKMNHLNVVLSVVTCKGTQQMQQAEKQVVN